MIPSELFVVVNARGHIVVELGNGEPFTKEQAEAEAAYLDHSEPDYLGPHMVLRYVLGTPAKPAMLGMYDAPGWTPPDDRTCATRGNLREITHGRAKQ